VRTAHYIPSFKVPSKLVTGLNIDDDQPYEIFCIKWGISESGDPFCYDCRPVKKEKNCDIGNTGYLNRGEVMKLINMELVR
jgi:hypothetical protein